MAMAQIALFVLSVLAFKAYILFELAMTTISYYILCAVMAFSGGSTFNLLAPAISPLSQAAMVTMCLLSSEMSVTTLIFSIGMALFKLLHLSQSLCVKPNEDWLKTYFASNC